MAPNSSKATLLYPSSINNIPLGAFEAKTRGNCYWRTLFTSPLTNTDSLSVGIATCPPLGTLALHRHKQSELYHVLSGTGEIEIDGQRHQVHAGVTLFIPGDAEHGVFCKEGEELTWLYVFPEGCFEDVVYRFTNEGGQKDTVKAML